MSNDCFKGMEVRFGKCLEPTPLDVYLMDYVTWLEENIDLHTLIGGKVQLDDIWYVIESYDITTNSVHMIPITNAPSLSQQKDNSPRIGGERGKELYG